MENFNDDLYPLALLMDELKHDDVSNRVQAMQKVDTIAMALGPERTINELLPFLNDVAQDDEEEVFAVLATKLGDFIPLIGGHQNCEPLIQILLHLAPIEEPIVRDKAIASLNNISTELTNEEVFEIFLPIIRDLSQGNWFSKRIASCGLYKSVVVRVEAPVRQELLALFLKLVTDDGPMVRRSAATNLPAIINKLTDFTGIDANDPNKVTNKDWEIISQMFQSLINDDQDSVKFLSIDVLISILEYFQKIQDQSHNSDFLVNSLKLMSDESWRVRYTAADRFNRIAENFGNEEAKLTKLIEPFISLMKDNEGEVRKAIAKQLPAFCKSLNKYEALKPTILNKILPVVNELSQDPQENVRSSLALNITELSSILSKQSTIDKLLPIFLNMLKDEFPDVRLNIISNLSIVNETIGINLLTTSLLPAITELAQDSKWRVRLAIIEYIPKLADQLGEEFFNKELLTLCLSWLWDSVYAIREASVKNLRKITEIFGSAWADKYIIDKLVSIKNNTHSSTLNNNDNNDDTIHDDNDNDEINIDFASFIIRITCVFALNELIPVLDHQIITEKVLPFLNDLIDDKVPNIRFNLATSYLRISETLAGKQGDSPVIEQNVLKNLDILVNDNDSDVRYFASKSIDSIKELLAV
ncbi:protein phosphatase 2A structural subunit [Yamadazyma tenuis]|uniref:ARM repeat-containing protein n=1 Tax=Candida tenuis (strain ATCC 10573 / BCRC 21748 / CBS 615 / JCM 9827 / NBRC 10315 / NRRL Y-1498 / VKM Y-70) TaxID=590646 RepID=G3B3B6_CANTC|nr:ARM repeat-containing protein [Yamadazyma tenuis ATCC 10573]EGV64129.1 ARM repeat-containing protein [Yamadazyma tenuis ATCC 10573]WEJ96235.1 protein phosphatase 2A structural subunit [Yamadazyma tenuis]